MQRLFLLLVLLILASPASAQPTKTQTTLWYRLYATKPLSQKLKAGLLIEDRKYLNPWRSHIFLTELNLQRKVARQWTVGIHGTYLIFALPHDPQVRESVRMDELRTHQSITFPQIHLKKVGISLRSMVEQRWFSIEGEDRSMDSYTYTYLRLRHRLRVRIPLTKRLSCLLSDEYMIQARKDLHFRYDQNRAGVSAMVKVNDQVALELGYLHWHQRRAALRFSRHSLRTGIYLKL
ncbi:MAG: DUF2490 domain-containing protein [Bacteroidota bacterium]